jgi:hypothetical protein
MACADEREDTGTRGMYEWGEALHTLHTSKGVSLLCGQRGRA